MHIEGVKEYSLRDIVTVDGIPNTVALAKHVANEKKLQLDVFPSAIGATVRYTSTRDWISYVYGVVDGFTGCSKGDKGSVIVLVDVGYHFARVFKDDDRVVLLTLEQFALGLDGPLGAVDSHVAVCVVSCAGIAQGYLQTVQDVLESAGGGVDEGSTLGNVLVGVLDVVSQ